MPPTIYNGEELGLVSKGAGRGQDSSVSDSLQSLEEVLYASPHLPEQVVLKKSVRIYSCYRWANLNLKRPSQ